MASLVVTCPLVLTLLMANLAISFPVKPEQLISHISMITSVVRFFIKLIPQIVIIT